jgi:hypothetical protein
VCQKTIPGRPPGWPAARRPPLHLLLLDQADAAAIPGDVDKLANALIALGERLLVTRPFIPDKNNPLPANWKAILRKWVSGTDVDKIGAHNMRVVEEAFTYRLAWALEAIRTRRANCRR